MIIFGFHEEKWENIEILFLWFLKKWRFALLLLFFSPYYPDWLALTWHGFIMRKVGSILVWDFICLRNAERGYPETSQFKINKTWSGRRAIRPSRRKSTRYTGTMKPLSRTYQHVAAWIHPSKPYMCARYGHAIYVHLWTETRRNDR